MLAFGIKVLTLHPQSGCSAVGSALRSGRRGRAFESPHPDSGATNRKILFVAFYLLLIDAI